MSRLPRLKPLLDELDKPTLRKLADTLLAQGHTADEVIEDIVAVIDASVDWAAIGGMAGPVGSVVGGVLETVDGPVATLIARSVVHGAERRRAKRAA